MRKNEDALFYENGAFRKRGMTMQTGFPEVKKKLGFGAMRLPMIGEKVDLAAFSKMVDLFLSEGFNYFDTAHPYLNGESELALREALTSRYPREAYLLANKLTAPYFDQESDIRPFFEKQLQWCGVSYFDFYLMHAQNLGNYDKFQRCHAYETAFALKKEGKIRHVGLSFHDKAEVLERILGDHPDVEFVQIQMNYIDMESTAVDARRVYETCLRFHKPVIVMEPVKGGSLVKLPPKAQHLFDTLQQGAYPKASNASYAIRFVAGHEGIFMVLSGMSTLSQVADNTSFMKDFKPLTDKEKRTLDGVVEVFSQLDAVPCTACRYCIEENHCPKKIPIPDIFSHLNSMRVFNNHNANFYYENVVTANAGKASDCILCGACEHVCPQHLTIRKFLKEAAATFEEPKKG